VLARRARVTDLDTLAETVSHAPEVAWDDVAQL
jgi:hypothetical protein